MARIDRPYALVMWHPDTTPVPVYTMKLVLEGARLGGDPDKPAIWVSPGYDTIREVRVYLAAGKRVAMAIDEPVSYELSGDRKAEVKAIMQAAVKAGESLVRLAPEQWMSWFGLWHWWSEAEKLDS